MQQILRRTALLISLPFLICTQLQAESFSIIRQFYEKQREQNTPSHIEWYGFARLDSFLDSRQAVTFRNGTELSYPKEPSYDDCCCDINSQGLGGFSPAVSRIGLNFYGPPLECAKAHGNIEADFYGVSNSTSNLLRMRFAYMQLDYGCTSWMIGQHLHPINNILCMPEVIDFATGEPIAPYSHNPQIRFTYKSCGLDIMVAAYEEFQTFLDNGVDGASPIYMQRAMFPGIHGQLIFKWCEDSFIGGGLDARRITPREKTTSNQCAENGFANYIAHAFMRLSYCHLNIRTAGIWAENGQNLQLISGYAVASICDDNDTRTWTPTKSGSGWIDVELDTFERFVPGIFVGYTKNLGAVKNSIYLDGDNNPIFFGANERLNYVGRISGRVWIRQQNYHVGIEAEYTRAGFGPMQSTGKVNQQDVGTVFRLLSVFMYIF